MNVSITDELATYVRRKVKSGRYNNASEVIRDALRRMEEEDARVIRLAGPTAEALLSDLTSEQTDLIRRRVLQGLQEIREGKYTTFDGLGGLRKLADRVKARGRRRLAVRNSRRHL